MKKILALLLLGFLFSFGLALGSSVLYQKVVLDRAYYAANEEFFAAN